MARTEGWTEIRKHRMEGRMEGSQRQTYITPSLLRIKTTPTMNKFFIKFIYSFIYITTGTI